MRRSLLILGMTISLIFSRIGIAATPAEIDAAIAKGQAYLLSQMKAENRWEQDAKRQGNGHDWPKMQGSTWGGFTAIATYALLASGKSPQDKQLAPAIQFLKTANITGAYALGTRAQVWSLLPPSQETLRLYQQDYAQLIRTLNTRGQGIGLWDYEDPTVNGARIDHSIAQFGVLGIWACAQGGVVVEPRHWVTFDKVWRSHQYDNGGWSYNGDGKRSARPISHTMTAAGIATLFITQDYLPNAGKCDGNVADINIERGLKWMNDNFSAVKDNNYLWYGIERIGAASGRKYFGGKNWFSVGAEEVVRSQKPDGSWETKFVGATRIPDTAFALLFLARGRAPIIISKLERDPPPKGSEVKEDWNQRPRDIANVTRWIARQRERYLSWQVVTLKSSLADLLESPILYISGSRRLFFSDDDIKVLREFVEAGGLILGNADCGKTDFAIAFRKLGSQLFPKYEFRELPPTHPILASQQFRTDKWKEPVSVLGLSNGSRELMLLIPSADAGRAWQQRADKLKEPQFQLAANIYLYATDKRNDRAKGQSHLVADLGIKPEQTIKLARLEVGDNWNPEPGGWRRLTTVLRNDYKLDLVAAPMKLGEGRLSAKTARVAHLTGTTGFQLSATQRAELKKFVIDGGTLIIDATGGSTVFSEAAERELEATFGADAAAQLKSTLPIADSLFSNPAAPIKRVAYRRTAVERITGGLKVPRLRGFTVNKRLAVIFSREDISTGLVGHAVDGVMGYDPASATAIMRNVMLMVAGINAAPATSRPTTRPASQPAIPGDGLD